MLVADEPSRSAHLDLLPTWMTLGLIVYFLYSMRSSVLARQS